MGALEKVDNKTTTRVFTLGSLIEANTLAVLEFAECFIVVFSERVHIFDG